MTLTRDECMLLQGVLKSGIKHAVESGIPIGREYERLIDSVQEKLAKELCLAQDREWIGR